MIVLPRLYPILDAGSFSDALGLLAAAQELSATGVTLIQYRNKSGNAKAMLEQARELRRLFPAHAAVESHSNVAKGATLEWGTQSSESHNVFRLIMNDRADLGVAAEFDGVHVGQEDLSPEAARRLGVSTHNPEQVREGDLTSVDYLAIGPVFATSSKDKPDPVVGLEGVRGARALTRKPLVAIGGITRANAASVIEAGADSVAVISDLLREPRKSAEEFFHILR
jgi:thiamine-phosphate pyrophosphorylase